MADRQHTVILVVRMLEPSPSDPHHLLGFAEDVHDAFRDIDSVAAYASFADLRADMEAGVLVLD